MSAFSPAQRSLNSDPARRGEENILHGSPKRLFINDNRSSARSKKSTRSNVTSIPEEGPTSTKWWPVSLILFSSLVLGVTWMIMLGFFSQYCTNKKNISLTAVGFIYGTQEITTSIVVPLTSMFSAQGFLIGQVIMALGQVGMVFANGFSGNTFLWLSEAARVVSGTGSAFLQTGTLAWICKLISNKQRGVVFGLWKTFSGAGMVIGPTLGTWLYGKFGFDLPYIVVAIGCGAMGVLGIPFFAKDIRRMCCGKKDDKEEALLEEGREDEVGGGNEEVKKATWCNILAIPSVSVIGFLNCWQILCFMFIDPTLGPHMQATFGSSDQTISLYFSIYYGAFAVLAPFAGWIGSKYGNLRTILLGVPIVAIGLVMLNHNYFHPTFISDDITQLIAMIIVALGSSFSGVPVSTYIVWAADRTGWEGSSDIAVGFYSFTYSLGAAVGPLVGSAMVDAISFDTTSFIFGACIASAWVLTMLLYCAGSVIDDANEEDLEIERLSAESQDRQEGETRRTSNGGHLIASRTGQQQRRTPRISDPNAPEAN